MSKACASRERGDSIHVIQIIQFSGEVAAAHWATGLSIKSKARHLLLTGRSSQSSLRKAVKTAERAGKALVQ